MDPVPRILAATDFSASTEPVLEWAAELARRFDAEVLLLHVSEILATVPASDLGAAEREAARQELNALAETMARRGLRVRSLVRIGVPYDEIVATAAAEDARLIVMGTHGRSGLAHMLMGSVAERVVRRAPCPVLTVRHPQTTRASSGPSAAG